MINFITNDSMSATVLTPVTWIPRKLCCGKLLHRPLSWVIHL